MMSTRKHDKHLTAFQTMYPRPRVPFVAMIDFDSTGQQSNVVSRLQQLGFSSEEISALDVLFEGDAKKGNLRKQKMSEGVERPTENPGDADVARGNEDSPEVDIVEGPRGGEGADAGKADANVPGIDTESAGR